MRMEYPQREPYFAHKFVRKLHKSCAAQDIGQAACYLCCIVAHTEDSGRYTGPARFWRSQLMETLGFKSPKQLVIARQRATDAGWLVYQQQGTRAVGEYFVTIPGRFADLSDDPIEGPISSASGTESGTNNGTNRGGLVPLGDHKRNGKRSTSLPIPKEDKRRAPGGAAEQAGNGKKIKHTEADLECANWIFAQLRAVHPNLKEPRLDSWANDVRLMRERDKRTIEQIRECLKWATADSFWSANILSPRNLREKFDRLAAKMNAATRHKGNGHAKYDPHTGLAPGERYLA